MEERTIVLKEVKVEETRPTYMVVEESPLTSLLKDVQTFAVLGAFIYVGVIFGSVVMEVVGALLGMSYIVAATATRKTRLSAEDARTKIDEIERRWLEKRK